MVEVITSLDKSSPLPPIGDAPPEPLYNRITDSPPKTSNPVLSTGEVEKMSIPAGWTPRSDVSVPTGAGLTEFNPPGQPTVRLDSFYRGQRIDEDDAKTFKDCLAQPPHALSAKELQSLSTVLRDKDPSNFDVFFAKTENLNGKNVLSIEGTYKNDPTHTSAKTLYVDSDGTGSAVQEISYTASGKDYQKNLTAAEKSLNSIVWR